VRRLFFGLLILPVLIFASPILGPGVDIVSGGVAASGSPSAVCGWSFESASVMQAVALGIWVEQGPLGLSNLTNAHEAGLWTADGSTLLASATVPPAVANYYSASGLGGWLFVGVPALTLVSGTYLIGATYGSEDADRFRMADPSFGIPMNISTLLGVTVLEARVTNSTSVAKEVAQTPSSELGARSAFSWLADRMFQQWER
jgi:hypothetical protein